jgi:hypothetical protein
MRPILDISKRKAYRILVGKLGRKKSLGKPRRQLEDNNVTFIAIARQRIGKRIPATHVHVTIENPLLSNSPVNTFPLKRVTKIGSPLLSNGAVNKLRQQYRLCFPLGPCKVVIREANSKAGSCCRSTEQ